MADQVSKEVAEAEFERFCDEMGLDVDTSVMDDDDKKGIAVARGRFVKAVRAGRLSVDDEGVPTFIVKGADGDDPIEVTFPEPRGAALLASDRGKKGHDVAKMFLLMAQLTGKEAKFFSDMRQRDLSVCMAITNLFLG